MVNAQELINKQKEREQIKTLTYDKIYSFIEKKIILSSEGNSYYTWYQIPEFFIGLPLYSIDECQIYIRNKLKKNGFKTEFYQPNILLIKWFSS
jgi:hypothetical protein